MAIQAISRTRRITVVNKGAINLVRRVASPRSIVVDARERVESGSDKDYHQITIVTVLLRESPKHQREVTSVTASAAEDYSSKDGVVLDPTLAAR